MSNQSVPVPPPNSTAGGIYTVGYNAWKGPDGLEFIGSAENTAGIGAFSDKIAEMNKLEVQAEVVDHKTVLLAFNVDSKCPLQFQTNFKQPLRDQYIDF